MRLVGRWWSLSGSDWGCGGGWGGWHSGMASDGVVGRVCGAPGVSWIVELAFGWE